MAKSANSQQMRAGAEEHTTYPGFCHDTDAWSHRRMSGHFLGRMMARDSIGFAHANVTTVVRRSAKPRGGEHSPETAQDRDDSAMGRGQLGLVILLELRQTVKCC